jgi:hypothetical protein
MGSVEPSLSIVVEWENARLAEAERPLAMLAELARQLDELAVPSPRPVEIVLLHNPEAVDGAAIEAMIDHARPRDRWAASFRLLASADRTYYEQKNFGVASTSGDIVLLLDSDVVPEPGWLQKLLAAFDDPAVAVVCGSTYIELASLYDRAVALFWLFPLRPEGERMEEAKSFYANNVAFRRAVIAANPFPDLPTFRGQCRMLSERLRTQGIRILRHTGARVSHPPPNGWRHFVNRALCEGHDEAVRDRERGRSLVGRGMRDFWRRMRYATGRVVTDRRAVGLSPLGAFGAWSVALGYYALKLTGRLLTALDPSIVRRHFPIS